MPVEMLTYAELGERLKISPEAARALVKRHRLPRSRSNDGKTLVQVDLSEINHSPNTRASQSPGGHQVVTALKEHIATLQADLVEMKAIAGGHRADFERECDRTNKLLAELLKANIETVGAREKAARLEGTLSTVRPPWWRRLTAFTHIPLEAVWRNSLPSSVLKVRGASKEDRASAQTTQVSRIEGAGAG
ncbi:hypothetical protein AYJ54_12255 [Bradyrhizobium centrolobii]|uniref:Helix-turn-helix domain-containing protein n=1 Tax=Bradyrhizobium centrolobii TaxID=1505087 RepID=A0A176YQU4_9BRAD|nr:hypothetical protein [Bradyrhizobium centrolobii]OAF09961.1 hypothetical protein AYJ54_12255 [Bradyrhizobium centrolobii]